MSRLTIALGVALLVVEMSVAVAIIATDSEDPWLTIGFAVTAGVAFVLSGLIALALRPENRTGVYLAATGYVWFFGALAESSNEWVFTVGFALGNLVWVPFTALVLAYPTGRLETRLERSIPIAAGALLVVPAVIAALLDPTPAAYCDSCPESAIAIADRPAAGSVFDVFSTFFGLALIALVVGVLVRRWRRASPALRRLLWPVAGAGIAALLAVALVVVAGQISQRAENVLSLVFFVAFTAVPLSFLFGVLRTRLARSASASMFVSLEEGAPLHDALARALNDRSLDVAYWLPERSIWVNADGTRVPAPEATPERSVTIVERQGLTTAALIHDPALDEEPELLRAIADAAGLSLRNEGLRAALRAQYLFLETITDTAPSLLVAVGLDGHILNQNRAAVEAAGYDDEEEVRGLLFWDAFMDPEERPDVVERFRAAAPDFAPAEYENTFVNRRRERLSIAWRSAPLHDDSGAVISIIAGGTDVTERKRREEELRASEERFRAVIESAPVAIVEMGLDEKVNLWNPAAERIFGWSSEEVLGRFPRWVPEDLEGEFRALSAREATGETYTGVETIRARRDGERLNVEISAAPIRDGDGAVIGAMAVLSDISDRKRQEEELRASRARLVAAGDEARQRLERDLHDGAQQRLVALSLALRLLESKLHDDPGSAVTILAGAREELTQALEELRELARGIHPAVLTDRGLGPAVDALVARAPIPVDVDVSCDRLPTAVEAASYYVVAEALTNVAKYAQASRATVHVQMEDDVAVIEVHDDGVGGADPADGSGLRGLADRVTALDGTLAVHSPAGEGTQVRATIPVREPSAVQ